jgi:hypothetical protein
MAEIELTYRSRPWGLYEKSRLIDFPSKLSDLSYKQFILLANITGDVNENEFLADFLNIPRRICRKLSANQKLYLFELFETYEKSKFMDKVIIDKFRFQHVTYLGPSDKFSNVTFGEFCFADTHFLDYINEENEEALNKFIAVLYRPERKVDVNDEEFNGDWRVNFTSHHTMKRAETLTAFYPPLKKAIVLNYSKIRAWLEEAYPYVFPKEEKKQKEGDKEQKKQSWLPVLENMAGNDIINLEKYSNLPLHQALRYLNNRIRDYYKGKN